MTQGLAGPDEIATRQVPQRRLATMRAEVDQAEVADFIGRAFTTLFEFTNSHKGLRSRSTTPASPTYALYYGTFAFDTPTLVEVCVVLDRDLEPGDLGPDNPEPGVQISVRTDPAHWEAYLPLTKRRLALPSLTAAYNDLGYWVSQHGRILTNMPPREVYIADVMAAGDDDHVCDVAFPFEPRR